MSARRRGITSARASGREGAAGERFIFTARPPRGAPRILKIKSPTGQYIKDGVNMTEKEKILKYFERIGLEYDENAELNGEYLRKLQLAHVTAVPYENIDILRGTPLKLDDDSLFDKVVLRRRGGYCFELNGILAWLLRALGFGVTEYMGRFLRGEVGVPMRRHRVLKVEAADGVYMCDVGVGAKAPRCPLLLKEGLVQKQFGEEYRFEKRDFFGWVLTEKTNKGWGDVFSFTEEVQHPIDFVQPSFYCEKHEDSIFNKDYMIAIKTLTGRKTLDNNTFKIFEGSELISAKELSDSEIPVYLKEHFGLDV